METIFNLISSPAFRGAMHNLGLVSLLLCGGAVIIALAYYGRARDPGARSPEEARWILLIGTWRDSLIITLLYTGETFLYKFSDFNGLSEVMAETIYAYPPIVTPVVSFVISVLIFTVAALRIIALTRWLANAGRPTSD